MSLFGKKDEPEEGGIKGYDIAETKCSKCGKLLANVKIAVNKMSRDSIKEDETKITDLILRHIHKHCPFCGEKTKNANTSYKFEEVAGAAPAATVESPPEPPAGEITEEAAA